MKISRGDVSALLVLSPEDLELPEDWELLGDIMEGLYPMTKLVQESIGVVSKCSSADCSSRVVGVYVQGSANLECNLFVPDCTPVVAFSSDSLENGALVPFDGMVPSELGEPSNLGLLQSGVGSSKWAGSAPDLLIEERDDSPSPCSLGADNGMICSPLSQGCHFNHMNVVSNFLPMPSLSDMCKNAILGSKDEGLIKYCDNGYLDPNTLSRDGDKQFVVFDNQLLGNEGDVIVWTELAADRVPLQETGVDADLVTPKNLRIGAPGPGMGVLERDEEMLSDWVLNKLGEFDPFLGLSYKGFEEEILGLFKRIVMKRELGTREGGSELVVCKKLRSELKKLECNVNYERNDGGSSAGGPRKGKGIVRCAHGS